MPTDDPLFGKGTIRAERPQDPSGLSVRGEEARRNPRARGTTTSWSAPSRRTRLHAARQEHLSAAEEVTIGCPAARVAGGIPSRSIRRLSVERSIDAGSLRAASGRTDQRLVLRAAQPWARRDLRHAQHHQFRAWRALHDGRVLRLFPAQRAGHRLLAGADHRADRGRHFRHDPGADHAAMAVRPRSSLRTAADVRHGADHPGRVPELFRLVRSALCDSRSN